MTSDSMIDLRDNAGPAWTPQQWGEQVRSHLAQTVESILAAGRDLAEAKMAVEHGQWGDVLEAAGIGERTAQMLMSIADHRGLANPNHGSVLPSSWRTLYELSKLKPSRVHEAIESGEIKPDMTRQAAVSLRTVEEHTTDTPDLPVGTYRCLVIDPPWPVKKIERDVRDAQAEPLDYPTMTLDEIGDLNVGDLAADGCHLYLWTTHKFLPAALEIADGWGFKYQCLMTWRKNVGMTPFSWMYDTEHVVFARKGPLDLDRKGLRLSFGADVTEHSAKPDVFYERVREASPEPRCELFARDPHDGFEAWGNEAADG